MQAAQAAVSVQAAAAAVAPQHPAAAPVVHLNNAGPAEIREVSALAESVYKIMQDTDFSESMQGAAGRRTTSRCARLRAGGCRGTSGDSCGGGRGSGGGRGRGGWWASEGLRRQGNKDWKIKMIMKEKLLNLMFKIHAKRIIMHVFFFNQFRRGVTL